MPANEFTRPVPELTQKNIERFLKWVNQGSTDECWEWQGFRDKKGYGQFCTSGSTTHRAHRVAYWIAYRTDISGLCILHECDNPPCCNPRHLFTGTDNDNLEDALQKNRKAKGIRIWSAKITDADVVEIRRRASSGESNRSIALDYPINEANLSKIVNKRTWRHIK